MQENIEQHNISVGKLMARHRNIKRNLYYTPIVLTSNSLVFDRVKMTKWWKDGFEHAKKKDLE